MRLWAFCAAAALFAPGGSGAPSGSGAERPATPVRKIVFEGSETFEHSALRHLMSTRQRSWISRRPFDPEAFARDLDNLAAFYMSEGFLDVKVLAHPPAYAPDGTAVDLRIVIAEGPRWTVSGVDIGGAQILPRETLLARLRLRPGQTYRPLLLSVDRSTLLDEYAARGHLDARVSQRVALDRERRQVSIAYEIVEGPVAAVSKVTVQGLEKTKRSTVLRELDFAVGDRFNLTCWGRSQSNLYNTGLFDWVWIQPASADAGKPQKEVLVLVGEKPRWEISAGVGYGRFDEARVVTGVRQGNLFGRGVRSGLEGKASRKVRRGEFTIAEPWLLGHRLSANGAAVYEWRDEPEFLAESVQGALVMTRAVRTRVSAEAGYQLRRTNLLRVDPSPVERDRTNRTSVLGAALTWRMRDDVFNTTRGFSLRIEGEYAGTFLGGTNQFLRGNVSWQHFASLPRGVVLASSTRLGAISPLHRGVGIPINERYFMGGDRSVRGYPRHSLGPADAQGRPRGGRKLAELGQEFRFPLGGPLRGVLFCDEGILFDAHPRSDDWAVGAGAGLRIVTPFGLFRAEAARPLTERWGTGWEYYFSVGEAF